MLKEEFWGGAKLRLCCEKSVFQAARCNVVLPLEAVGSSLAGLSRGFDSPHDYGELGARNGGLVQQWGLQLC